MKTLVCTALLLLAGCAAPAAPPADTIVDIAEPGSAAEALAVAAEAPPVAAATAELRTSTPFPSCGWCYEPTVAVDPAGRVFVTSGSEGEGIAVSEDAGATWTTVPVPPLPTGAPPTALRGDPTVQVDRAGRLVYHALLLDYVPVATGAVIAFEGFQVAASGDAGGSWEWNTYLAPATTQDAWAEGDRQWMAFGPDGAAYMTQNQYVAFARVDARVPLPVFPAVGTGLKVAASEDGGRSFGPFREVVARPPLGGTIGGQPVVDAAGRLLVPYFVYGGPSGLFVAVSDDGGASFDHHVVHAPRDGFAGAMFPSLAFDGAGRAYMAWWTGDAIQLATSDDGGRTWSASTALGTGAAVNSPWLLPTPDGVDVLWSEAAGDDASTAWLVRAAGRVALGTSEGMPGREAYTDFLHAARTPDGGLVAVLVGAAGRDGRVDAVFAPAP